MANPWSKLLLLLFPLPSLADAACTHITTSPHTSAAAVWRERRPADVPAPHRSRRTTTNSTLSPTVSKDRERERWTNYRKRSSQGSNSHTPQRNQRDLLQSPPPLSSFFSFFLLLWLGSSTMTIKAAPPHEIPSVCCWCVRILLQRSRRDYTTRHANLPHSFPHTYVKKDKVRTIIACYYSSHSRKFN